jgi:hypothetical protein
MPSTRPFDVTDRGACLTVFDSNVPAFFDPEEHLGYEKLLQERADSCGYLVIERDGQLVGCGGVVVEADGETASLCWGMVKNGFHRSGLGRVLTNARLQAVKQQVEVTRVIFNTSQHTVRWISLGMVTVRGLIVAIWP